MFIRFLRSERGTFLVYERRKCRKYLDYLEKGDCYSYIYLLHYREGTSGEVELVSGHKSGLDG